MKKIIFILSLLLPTQGWAVIAVVDSVGVSTYGVDSATTSSINTTGANLLICDTTFFRNENDFSSITDSKSNTYTDSIAEFASSVTGDVRARQQYKENASVGSGHTFTIQFTGNAYFGFACTAVSGALTTGALDKTATKADNSGSSGQTSSLTATTSQADELLAGAGAVGDGQGVTISFTATGGFTTDENFPNVSNAEEGIITAHKVVSATGTYQFTFDLDVSTSGTMGWISTWKASGGAPTVIRHRPIVIQ